MNESQLAELIQNQARMAEQIRTLFHNQAEIKALTETVQKLAVALERQGAALSSTERKVDDVKADVDELRSRPRKRWDAVAAAVISGLVGFILARLGLK